NFELPLEPDRIAEARVVAQHQRPLNALAGSKRPVPLAAEHGTGRHVQPLAVVAVVRAAVEVPRSVAVPAVTLLQDRQHQPTGLERAGLAGHRRFAADRRQFGVVAGEVKILAEITRTLLVPHPASAAR